MYTLCHSFFRVSPNNKNKEGAVVSKKKYALGIVILLLVVVLWVLSSEITKYIYNEKKIERPFLVTYVRSSFLFIYLVVLCFTPPTKDPCRPADYTQLMEPNPETDDENFCSESNNSLSDSTFVPVRAGETTDSDDAAPRAVRFNKVAEVRVMSASMAGEALLARLSWSASLRASQCAQRRAAAAATRRHFTLALTLTVPWFMSQYLFRVSLLYGASSSAAVYASSCGAMALCAGAVFAAAPHDAITPQKAIAVALTVAALTVLGIAESHTTTWTAVLSALGSAVFYAIHLLLFRQAVRKGDGVNAPLLVGLVGCAIAGLSWVVGYAATSLGAERGELQLPRAAAALLLDAAAGPLLQESLWLWGRSLTSWRAARGVLALAAPLAAAADAARGHTSPPQLAAAALAAAGWALAATEPGVRCLPAPDAFRAIRNIPELDEQSEALMLSSDEPT